MLHILYFRLGGTAADLLYFKEVPGLFKAPRIKSYDCNNQESSNSTVDKSSKKWNTNLGQNQGNCYCTVDKSGKKVCENLEKSLYKNRTAFAMSGKDWIHINEFAQKVGFSFLFDVNVLVRNKNNNWRYV